MNPLKGKSYNPELLVAFYWFISIHFPFHLFYYKQAEGQVPDPAVVNALLRSVQLHKGTETFCLQG